jgi:hypothetical protein
MTLYESLKTLGDICTQNSAMQYISAIVGWSEKIRLSLLHSVELHLHHALNHSHPSTLLLPQFSLSMFRTLRILSILTCLLHSTPYRSLFHLTYTYFTLSHILIRSQCRSLFPHLPERSVPKSGAEIAYSVQQLGYGKKDPGFWARLR